MCKCEVAEDRGKVRQIVSSDGNGWVARRQSSGGSRARGPSPPRTQPLPPPPCAAPGLCAPRTGRPGRPKAAVSGRAAGCQHAQPSRRSPCGGARGGGELRCGGKTSPPSAVPGSRRMLQLGARWVGSRSLPVPGLRALGGFSAALPRELVRGRAAPAVPAQWVAGLET